MALPHTRSGSALLVALVASAGGAGALWQCAVYDRSLLIDGADAADAPLPTPMPEASVDADTCARTRWPPRPNRPDNGMAIPEVINAIRTLDFGPDQQADSGKPLGFDLDGVCTCPGTESCAPLKGAPSHCDLDGGRDNAGGALIATLGSISANLFDTSGVNARLKSGFYGLVIRLRNYDGTSDDPRVEVSVYISGGPEGEPVDSGQPPDDGGARDGAADAAPPFTSAPPKYDGTDRWSVDTNSLLGGTTLAGVDCDKANIKCAPVFVDTQGYVANNQVVGRLDFPLSLGSGSGLASVVINLVGSVVTAKLIPEGTSFRVEEGQIAGRWATGELLTSLQQLHDPFDQNSRLSTESEAF